MNTIQNTLLLFIVFLTGLVSESCTREIEFNDKLLEPKLVVNGIVALDSVFSIDISSSRALPGYQSDFKLITDASAILFTDGIQTEKLIYGAAESGKYRGNTLIESGKSYRIEVEHKDFRKATSAEMKPGKRIPVLHVSANIDSSSVALSGSSSKIKSTIKFSDPTDEENYYRLDISFRIGRGNFYTDSTGMRKNHTVVMDYYASFESLESNDPVLAQSNTTDNLIFDESNSRYTVFTDQLFNGKEYELGFFLNSSLSYQIRQLDTTKGDFYRIYFDLQSLTKDVYWYIQSSGTMDNLSGGLFTEPIQVYNNIRNGLGIWGAYSSSIDSIQVGVYPREGFGYSYGSVNY